MRFLFVGGCERSGTTLVQKALVAHRRVVGGPELVFTPRIVELFERMRAEYPEEFARRLTAHYDEEKLARVFRGFVRAFFEERIAASPEALWVSEKTPSNVFVAGGLLELFPDAHFVHVLRDGRDVFCSHRRVAARLRRAGRRAGRAFGARAVCGRWNRAVDVDRELGSDPVFERRYHRLRFEDLVAAPRPTLEPLFAALGLELEEAVLAPEEVTDERAGLVVDGFWSTEEWTGRGFDPSVAGAWRRELGGGSRLACEILMGRRLGELGYPVGALPLAGSRLLAPLLSGVAGPRRRPWTARA